MALEIFKLVGSILVDNDKANESISKTDEKAQGVGTTLLGGIKTAAKWGAGVVAAGAAGAAALYKTASSAAANADEIDKMSQKIGISRTAYQELDFILSQNGMDVNSLQGGMKTLVNTMQSAQAGTASAVGTFDALGVSVTDSTGALRSQEDVFYDAIAALQGMENETERNALANDLFGRSATEMAPLLNAGAGSMEELRQKAHDLGLVLSDETIDSGVVFTDTMDQLQRSMGSVMTQVGTGVMPLIQGAADWVLDHMPQIQTVCDAVFQFIGTGVSLVADGVSTAVGWISGLISDAGLTVDDVLTGVQTVFTDVWNALMAVWLAVGQPIWDALMYVVGLAAEAFRAHMPEIEAVVQTAFTDIRSLWEGHLKPAFQAIQQFVQNVLAPAFRTVFQGIILPVVSAVFNGIAQLWNGSLKPIFTNIIDFIRNVFTGNWRSAFQNLVNIVSGVFGGIRAAVRTPINAVIGIINGFLRGLNRLKIPSWIPVVGGKGVSIPLIPTLARGGVLEKGQVGFLEGNGAEAVVPLEHNRAWISAVARDMDTAVGGRDAERIVAVLLDILEELRRLRDMGIYLDPDKLVGYLIDRIDRKLGLLDARKART